MLFQSTHPREGVRLRFQPVRFYVMTLFQSTHPREGVRHQQTMDFFLSEFISIHAPPRRSATSGLQHEDLHKQFQSTHPREGVRPASAAQADIVTVFQSTHPREGVRPALAGAQNVQILFQSTHPREGVRRDGQIHPVQAVHFNPRTPAKECDSVEPN